jgi:hypothetical protein
MSSVRRDQPISMFGGEAPRRLDRPLAEHRHYATATRLALGALCVLDLPASERLGFLPPDCGQLLKRLIARASGGSHVIDQSRSCVTRWSSSSSSRSRSLLIGGGPSFW